MAVRKAVRGSLASGPRTRWTGTLRFRFQIIKNPPDILDLYPMPKSPARCEADVRPPSAQTEANLRLHADGEAAAGGFLAQKAQDFLAATRATGRRVDAEAFVDADPQGGSIHWVCRALSGAPA